MWNSMLPAGKRLEVWKKNIDFDLNYMNNTTINRLAISVEESFNYIRHIIDLCVYI